MKILWPSWRFGPDGKAAIFDRPEDVPEGWQDEPGKFPATAGTVPTVSNYDALKQQLAKAAQDMSDPPEQAVTPRRRGRPPKVR